MPTANAPERPAGSRTDLLRWIFFRANDGSTFRELFMVGLPAFLLAVGLNAGCQRLGFYDRAEWADLDRLQRAAPAARSNRIVVVLISDEDYADAFRSTSPLEPAKVTALVNAVCRFDPLAVGVDLVTSDWSAQDAERAKALGRCPIVWIADVEGLAGTPTAGGTMPPVSLGKVLGRTPDSDACWALSVLQPDADGVIRRYATRYPAVLPGSDVARPHRTFIWTLARSQATSPPCLSEPALDDRDREKKIPFRANESFPRVSARMVLESADPSQAQLFTALRVGVFGDKPIVIIGGAYRQARDRHRTPIGLLYGSEILANGVFAERENAEIVDATPVSSILVDLAVGTPLLALVTWLRLKWPWAVVASTALAVVAAFAISWSLYRYLGYFLGVFGAMAGMVLGIVVEACWDPLKAWAAELKARVANLS
jgi:CHASE2 domain-containing sensor protein